MLGRKSRPVIGYLITGSGYRAGLMDAATSPKSALEFKIQSPRGLKTYDVGKVGLGIVAALEKSDNGGLTIQAQKALYSRNLIRSDPIPVNSARYRGGVEEMEMDSLEDYTVVTCHKANKKSVSKVYCDGGEYGRNGFDGRGSKNSRVCVFDISPARFGDTTAYPTSDFLSSCHLCQKKLHGKDIYMYRGEKAFCSTECRYRQIAMDERIENCSSEVSRSAADVSNSPYTNGQIFSTGIFAV